MHLFPWKLCLVIAVGAVLWSPAKWLLTDDAGESQVEVVIGILSSRSNFEYRQAIRQTWLNATNRKSTCTVRGWFIVGRKACSIPPTDRVDIKACKRWDPKALDDNVTETFLSLKSEERSSLHQPVSEGFAFKVHHPVIINKLGYLSTIVPIRTRKCTVSLKNAVTEATVVKADFTSDKMGVAVSGYHYLPVTPYVLPKGFEALVVTELPEKTKFYPPFKHKWQDAGGVISFTQVFQSVKENLVVKHNEHIVSAASVGLSIYDKQHLKDHIAGKMIREKQWLDEIDKEDKRLLQEVAKYNDIILVELIDVYQNLPLKVLLFMEWISSAYKFNYLLKTDDDCVLDIDKILNELQGVKAVVDDNMWWSKFRYNWLVDRVSKWAEYDYLAPVYPPFACGLGSILSASLVHWLAGSSRRLHTYQGEDISLGIWLAAVLPKYLDDSRWQCDAGCVNNSFNVGQLKPEDIKMAWKYLQMCNSFCGC